MDIINPEIDEYIARLMPERPSFFIEIERLAEEKKFPAVGPQVGLMLELLARAVGARRIVELGSGFGYSGLWFARALPEDGEIILTDFDEKNLNMAREHFRGAGFEHLAAFQKGDALDLLMTMEGRFDIIFNDVDKELYPSVIEPAYEKLRVGGLFITDNSLGYGEVLVLDSVGAAPAIREFNQRMKEHSGFLTVQIPLREGLSVSVKR